MSTLDSRDPRIYKLGSVSCILHWIPIEPNLASLQPSNSLTLSTMSNPIEIASGTSTQAVYKGWLGEQPIQQFDAYKHPHMHGNVLEKYPTVGHITDVPR